MESLTDLQLPRDAQVKTSASANDRATIGKVEALKLQSWIDQMKEATRGFLSISKSDLVNFLIREHKDALTVKEMMQIRTLNYDPVKHINWISQELKSAFAKNDFAMVAILQSELNQVELSPQSAQVESDDKAIVAAPQRRRARRREVLSADKTINEICAEANLSNISSDE